jgi:hypothetical protein
VVRWWSLVIGWGSFVIRLTWTFVFGDEGQPAGGEATCAGDGPSFSVTKARRPVGKRPAPVTVRPGPPWSGPAAGVKALARQRTAQVDVVQAIGQREGQRVQAQHDRRVVVADARRRPRLALERLRGPDEIADRHVDQFARALRDEVDLELPVTTGRGLGAPAPELQQDQFSSTASTSPGPPRIAENRPASPREYFSPSANCALPRTSQRVGGSGHRCERDEAPDPARRGGVRTLLAVPGVPPNGLGSPQRSGTGCIASSSRFASGHTPIRLKHPVEAEASAPAAGTAHATWPKPPRRPRANGCGRRGRAKSRVP